MKYYIAQKRSYYGPSSGYSFVSLTYPATELRDAAEYDSLDQAQDALDEIDGRVYVTAHNESGRPEYKIIDGDEAYRLEQVWRHDDLGSSQYSWDHCVDPERPTDDEEQQAIKDVNDSVWDGLAEASE